MVNRRIGLGLLAVLVAGLGSRLISSPWPGVKPHLAPPFNLVEGKQDTQVHSAGWIQLKPEPSRTEVKEKETPQLVPAPEEETPKPADSGAQEPAPLEDAVLSGLTLDQILETFSRENLDIQAQALEISKARANTLTAGLVANPRLNVMAQYIPYGSFSQARPGGQTEYDLGVAQPLDLSGKRKARAASAIQAERVEEARYQDSIRLLIGQLYEAYAKCLSAEQAIRSARAEAEALVERDRITATLLKQGLISRSERSRTQSLLGVANIKVRDSETTLARAKQELGQFLSMNTTDAANLKLAYGDVSAVQPPAFESLWSIASSSRPDLVALRFEASRACQEIKLANANRFDDVVVTYQPYMFQNNAPFGTKSGTSWGLGAAIPAPIFNRNQGNIAKAQWTVAQVQIQTQALERKISLEVHQALNEWQTAQAAVQSFESEILPKSKSVRDDLAQLFRKGEANALDYLDALEEDLAIQSQYREAQVRLRRATFQLNTVTGQRILP